MPDTINIYCDESCHLPNDRKSHMTLGALVSGTEGSKEIATELRAIKKRHGLSPSFELKWSKASPSKLAYYQEILEFFFDESRLSFRALVAPKVGLQHEYHNQTHNDWYYKMLFRLVEPLLSPKDCFRIYLDKKDTQGGVKVEKLHEVLCNSLYDFDRKIVERVQIVESHDVEQLQLCDFLLGAMSHVARNAGGSAAKAALIDQLRARSGYGLMRSTLLKESKFNIFYWQAQGGAS